MYFDPPIDIQLQMCHFMTNITAVTITSHHGPKSPEFNLRMAQSSFSLNTSDKNTKIIHFGGTPHGSWMLWKTEFQINSYHTMSNDTNFADNIDRIVSFEYQEAFHGTISETQYASGNIVCHHLLKMLSPF